MKTSQARGLRAVLLGLFLLVFLAACGSSTSTTTNGTPSSQPVTLNLGYFPNLTHSAALVGVGQGIFKKDLPSNVTLSTKTFNAGPTEIQALLAGSIDIAFVGPAPAISGYTASNGTALQVIAGASSNGASFVVQANENITSPAQLAGKKLASPQKGGTQDVALRYYLQQNGLKASDAGGNVQIISTDNASILQLFKTGKIDGAWLPEPWATRLVEGKGKTFVNESTLWTGGQFATTLVVARSGFAKDHPDVVKAFLKGLVESVQYVKNNSTQAEQIASDQIKSITGSAPRADELPIAFANLTVTYDPLVSTVLQQADHSYSLGFVKTKPDLSKFFNLGPLNEVLTSQGLATVAAS